MSKKACVIIADGVEEIELGIIVNILNNAKISVTIADVEGKQFVGSSRSIQIKPDKSLDQVKNSKFDVIILPGGYVCSKIMANSEVIRTFLQKQDHYNKLIAAIGTAPITLVSHGIGVGKAITSYPSLKSAISGKGFRYDDVSDVVHDRNLITSRGLATTFNFALKIVCLLNGEKGITKIADDLLLRKIQSFGIEEIEVLIIVGVLRRAGVKVVTAGLLGNSPIKCKNKLVIVPHTSLEAIKDEEFDIVILPGGLPATKAMKDSDFSELLAEVLRKQEKELRLIAAIGTSPIVLEHHAIMKGRKLTSHLEYKEQLTEGGYIFDEVATVVKDRNLITCGGLGTTIEFALKVACIFTEAGNTQQIAWNMLLSGSK